MTDLSPAEQAVASVLALDNDTSVVLTVNQSKTIARAVVAAVRPLIEAEVRERIATDLRAAAEDLRKNMSAEREWDPSSYIDGLEDAATRIARGRTR